jgi:hypothetical protein
MRRNSSAFGCGFILICISVIVSNVSARATSTPEERAQWVETAHKLESSPLDDSLNKLGDAALQRVMDVHDVHVPLCVAFFSDFNTMKYTYAHAIMRQYMLASAAFVIENPDKAADTTAMNQSALESVLKTYQAICNKSRTPKQNHSTTC